VVQKGKVLEHFKNLTLKPFWNQGTRLLIP